MPGAKPAIVFSSRKAIVLSTNVRKNNSVEFVPGYNVVNMKKLSPTAAAEVQQERPFFYLLTAVLLGLYVLSVLGSEMWRQPGRLALFSVLMLIHLAAHWSVFVIQYPPSWYWPYLVLQGILVFPIIYLGGNLGVLFGLYMALIGESVGLLRKNTLHIAIFIAYYILLSLASYRLMIGGNFLAWGLYVLPMALFVSIYVWLYSRQAEARERAQKLAGELEVANRQLSEYAARVEDLSIAAERQRMARELHDTLSQGLAGLILQLEAADAHLAHDRSGRAREIVQEAMGRARATLADARQVIGNLREHPGVSQLGAAIYREVERFTQATGIPCEAELQLDSQIPDSFCEPTLRIIAEALTNIARHARASRAGARLTTNEKEFIAEVWDDGVGFDPSTVEVGHYGLLGMRERARLAGGKLEIVSEAGKGTRLILRFPFKEGWDFPDV